MQTHKLEISMTVEEGGWSRLGLMGAINENAKEVLEGIAKSAPTKLIIDFSGVTQLNSSGIRDWSLFIKAFKQNRVLMLDRCTEDVIRAINMVPNFAAGLPIRSVLRQYACDDCKLRFTEALTLGRDYEQGEVPRLPAKSCQKCGNEAEADEADEEFFLFLTV